MKKKWEVRYLVTAVASIPVYKAYGKTETYRQAAKDGWGTVYRDENNALVCDEDCSASLYTKNGGYFGIFPYGEINTKEMPKQAECAAIIVSDSCGFTVWAEDFSQIHIFVTRDENGLIDTYRVEYGESPICDGEVEISFEDLCQNEDSWDHSYRANIPGTVEYSRKQETEQAKQDAPEAAADSQQNAPSAASLIVIAAAEMQDRTQAQEAAAGEPEAAERKKNGGGLITRLSPSRRYRRISGGGAGHRRTVCKEVSTVTQFEKITESPEVLGAFLAALPVVDGPWDKEFHERYCADCLYLGCDACPHEEFRNNLEGDITLMKSALDGLQIAIGDALLPTFRAGTQGITDFITKLTHLCLEPSAHQFVPEKSQPQKDKDRPGGRANDCGYALVRYGPQALHRYSIPQRGAKVTHP